ncbi:MAG: bifunctional oligoribonuclease/PAP phosphatase NrnA [Synergistaceae bacterium]|jgi:phosphoesterase RecJ-like protein|nr:bifunctional oligoribonuclease/PAP phosphatase NrnA [Synergistaceae bacterium]
MKAKHTKKTGTAEAASAKTASPVSRKLLLEVAQALDGASSWILFSHMKMDGDAIGTAAALIEAGLLRGKSVRWIGPDPFPPVYSFLAHAESYTVQKEFRFSGVEGELCVFLDSSNEDRGVKGLRGGIQGAFILNIDHHGDNSRFGTLNCVDPTSSSTAELVWRVMKEAGWPITPCIAESLYTGIVADTGNFVFSNTSERTHQAAADLLGRGVDPTRIETALRQTRSLEGMHLWGVALERTCCWGEGAQFAMTWLSQKDFEQTGAIEPDTEMLVNQLLLVRGVRFAVLFVEEEGGAVKVSLRSKEGTVSAVTVAHSLGGGGHPRASGARLTPPLDRAVQAVRGAVESAYAEWASAAR